MEVHTTRRITLLSLPHVYIPPSPPSPVRRTDRLINDPGGSLHRLVKPTLHHNYLLPSSSLLSYSSSSTLTHLTDSPSQPPSSRPPTLITAAQLRPYLAHLSHLAHVARLASLAQLTHFTYLTLLHSSSDHSTSHL
jgi:hypothetical protein